MWTTGVWAFWKHDVDGGCSHFVPVRPSDVRVIEAGVGYLGVDGQNLQCDLDDALFVKWDEMLPTTEIYFKWVVGEFPSGFLPQPAEWLDDYVRYEVEGYEAPEGYVSLATLRARDSSGEQLGDWPAEENRLRIRLFPPASARRVWHVVLRIRHTEGTNLFAKLGDFTLSFGYMQI